MSARRNGFVVILGLAPCQGCGTPMWWQRDHHGRGWRSEDRYGARLPNHCPARKAAA